MNPIEFVSAGAGSGKTYRLTQVLAAALESGGARPHAVVATTFTVKAATELRQRARTALLENGRLDLATAIGQSRIGTVNSVCGQLLKRFCFELGLSPDQTVLSEAETKRLLATALDETSSNEILTELLGLTRRLCLDEKDWLDPVRKVLDAARANGIAAADLPLMADKNAAQMLANWPAADGQGTHASRLLAALDSAVADLEAALEAADAAGTKILKKSFDTLVDLRKIQRALSDGSWTWGTWLSATKLDPGVKLKNLVEDVVECAQTHESHPQFRLDISRFLVLTFLLAADAMQAFEEAKRRLGAVDFVDQELLLLNALKANQAVRDALGGELDLVLVDEFQDTNPLQLALFVELAKLAKRSVWVGDAKQAIYGFRGTDAALIGQVLSAIEGMGGKIGEPLTTSRRSIDSLVKLANAVFVPAFSQELPESSVRLESSRDDIDGQAALFDWTFESPKDKRDYDGLGPALTSLLNSNLRVFDKDSKVLRGVRPSDIAVLCKFNDHVGYAVEALSKWSIPTVSARAGLLSTPEASFVVACLRRLHDAGDTVASAIVVSLADGAQPENWLTDRLQHLQAGGKSSEWKVTGSSAHPLLLRLESLRPRLASLTPLEALRLVSSESHAAALCCNWSVSQQQALARIANLEALLELAQTYQDECAGSWKPATVDGLLRWLDVLATGGMDLCAGSVGGAVAVMTHHGAKGLEWPIVLLTGLGKGARSSLWDVRARTEGQLDPLNPLVNRFIHFWPYPYGKHSMPQSAANAEASKTGIEMERQALSESRRLFYVSFTRARDALVLVSTKKRGPARNWVDEVGASPLLFGETGDFAVPKGMVHRQTLELSETECSATPPSIAASQRFWFQQGQPMSRLPLWLRPSDEAGGGRSVGAIETVGTRIAIKGKCDMTALGSALHQYLALVFADRSRTPTNDEVQAILGRWGVATAVEPAAVVHQATQLVQWLEARWPGAVVRSEVPIEVTLPSGRRLRGQIDLLVELQDSWVLLDHKADPRSALVDGRLVREHGPQLDAYAEALTAAGGKVVSEKWLFLPVAAQMVRVCDPGDGLDQSMVNKR